MGIYIGLLFAVGFAFAFSPAAIVKKHKLAVGNTNMRYIAAFVIIAAYLIMVIGLRADSVGIDTWSYGQKYEGIAKLTQGQIIRQLKKASEPGYFLLQLLAGKLGIKFSGFNFIYSVFNVGVITYFIYKKSKMAWLSYFLYITYDFFVLDLSMMRQTTAMSIAVLAYMTDKNRGIGDFLKFTLLIAIAATIHNSAVIFLPAWFVKKIRYNDRTVTVAFVLIALALIFRDKLMPILHSLGAGVSEKYSTYDVAEDSVGMRQYLMLLVTLIFYLFVNKKNNSPVEKDSFFLLCVMLVMFPAASMGGGGVFMRIFYYYYLFMIIFIPNMLASLNRKGEKMIKYIIIGMYMWVGWMLYYSRLTSVEYNLIPFKFFWQS